MKAALDQMIQKISWLGHDGFCIFFYQSCAELEKHEITDALSARDRYPSEDILEGYASEGTEYHKAENYFLKFVRDVVELLDKQK